MLSNLPSCAQQTQNDVCPLQVEACVSGKVRRFLLHDFNFFFKTNRFVINSHILQHNLLHLLPRLFALDGWTSPLSKQCRARGPSYIFGNNADFSELSSTTPTPKRVVPNWGRRRCQFRVIQPWSWKTNFRIASMLWRGRCSRRVETRHSSLLLLPKSTRVS